MRRLTHRYLVLLGFFVLAAGGALRADEILLRNGTQHTGRFVRGDARVIEFQTGGKIESFRTSEVLQLSFSEPALTSRTADRAGTQTQPPVPPLQDQPPVRQVPPQPPSPSVTYPAGTAVTVRMTSEVDTDRHQVGDGFTAALEDPWMMGSQVVLPRGAEVRGRITQSKESGRIAGKSELALELTEIRVNGRAYPLSTGEYLEVGSSRGNRTAATVGGSAALGTVIGAIAGGGKGAAIGAVAGAAAGTGVQLMTKGQTLKIPVETILEFKLQTPVTVDLP